MRQSFPRAIVQLIVGLLVFGVQPSSTQAQDAADDRADLAAALGRAFSSDDLEWLPKQNRLLLKGKVNDAPAVFKIDSGAIGTLLTLKSAKDRNLRTIDFNATFTGASGTGKIYGSPVRRLQLGTSVDLTMQRLAVIDLPFLDGIDGVIGGDTLASTKAIIDYRHHKFRVPKGTANDSLEKIGTDAKLIVEKLERERSYLFVKVNHGAVPLRMIVDTGAQQTVIGMAAAARLKLTVQETSDRVVGAGAGANAPKIHKTLVDRLTLGKASFRNFACVVMAVDYLGTYSKTPIDGIIGADALASAGAVLSVAEALIVLPPEEIDMAGEDKKRKP